MKIDNTLKHYHLYVLKLERDKYYIGVTTKTPQDKLADLKAGKYVSAWAAKYPIVSLFDSKDLGVMKYDDTVTIKNKVVRKYMRKYGVNSVRGGQITTTDDIVMIGSYCISKVVWEAILYIIVLLLIIAILVAKIYLPE